MSKKFFFFLTSIVIITIFTYQIFLSNSVTFPLKESLPLYKSHIVNSTGNLPDIYFGTSSKPRHFNQTCALFPDLFDIRIQNDNWQTQETTNGTFRLFNAYIDDRNGTTVVRIVGTYDQRLPEETFFCQFWYNDRKEPTIVPSEVLFWLFHPKWGADKGKFDHPYLITCPLFDKEVPVSVSLVGQPCDNATNNLKIFYKKETRRNFVVCVKGLSFPFEDMSTRLAEWIELLNILGAEKINFYEFSVHPNTKKLLDYYVEKGKIEVTPLTLTGDVSNQPYLQTLYLHKKITERRLQEVIPYNDCLYKHLNSFRYVVLLDTDEVVVPVRNTWVELIETMRLLDPNKSSYMARNVYFLDTHQHKHEWFEGIPKYMHMLQHVYRAQNYTKPGFYVKGFHDTEKVIALHNHYPRMCFQGCTHSEINLTLAHLQHYRSNCVAGVSDCDSMKVNSVLDKRVWNFKEELVERVKGTFRDLNFFDVDGEV